MNMKGNVMKKVMVVVLLVLLAVSSAHAGIGAFVTWWDSKDYDTLYGVGGRIGMEVFSGIGIEGRVAYLTADDDHIDLDVVPFEALVRWRWQVSEAISPYIGAGVGYYLKNMDWKGSHDLDVRIKDHSCVGYFALAGLEVEVGPVSIFGEAKYSLVDEDDELTWRGTDVKEKYSLDGFSVNLGLKFGF